MALNPFFLQGSPSEQRLVQDLINEHLKIFGVEVIYIPRKFVRKETILEEVSSSKFNDNFALEAYISNFEGYEGAGDILTKFGMSLRDEITLIISKERFEDFISPFLSAMDQDEIIVSTRPREGDIIYFPLGKRLFEVKFVEHEQPFYQLGKTYVYEIKCELFEYEDEVGGWDQTTEITSEIDEILKQQGYITTIQLFGSGTQAEGISSISTGYVRKVFLNNDGYGYTSQPSIQFSEAPSGGITASAVAITTSIGGVYSIKEILLVNSGAGYTTTPNISIIGGNGVGAAATCEIIKDKYGINSVSIANSGFGYASQPPISFDAPTVSPFITASGKVLINENSNISQILISDAGIGYTVAPAVAISPPPLLSGIGTYVFNEVVTGSISKTTARVKSWYEDTKTLTVGINTGSFVPGELITGGISSAVYSVKYYDRGDFNDKYEQNDEIQASSNLILDFSEKNPFGNY
jgi:hypothetical protein